MHSNRKEAASKGELETGEIHVSLTVGFMIKVCGAGYPTLLITIDANFSRLPIRFLPILLKRTFQKMPIISSTLSHRQPIPCDGFPYSAELLEDSSDFEGKLPHLLIMMKPLLMPPRDGRVFNPELAPSLTMVKG